MSGWGRTLTLVVPLFLAACGGSGGKGSAPPIVEPPPPPPVMCEWDDTIPADDPACVEPPCEYTVTWENPTEREDGTLLDPDELVAATVYFFRLPEAPREHEFVLGEIPPYVLRFTHVTGPENRGIQYFLHMTVSNLDADGNPQESEPSNQVTKTCE